mgnify:CR=1 FL=1
MVICVLMGFITPLKDTPFTYLYKTMQGNTTQSISEHLPLTLIENTPILITLTIGKVTKDIKKNTTIIDGTVICKSVVAPNITAMTIKMKPVIEAYCMTVNGKAH